MDSEKNTQVDLYVFLSVQKRFALYIPRGGKFTVAREQALSRHSVPCLYMKESDSNGASVADPNENMTIANFEVIGLTGNEVLKEVFREFSKNMDAPPAHVIAKLETMADDILKAVAPDAATIKERFMQNLDALWLMNDAAAMSTLATLFAAANGMSSAKSFRDIVFATLVMDLPLITAQEETVDLFHRNPKALPSEVVEQFEQHPIQAYQLAHKTLPQLTDVAFELILTHHEKYNGEGYPRKLRSTQFFPLGQVFACAVEVFEIMKSQVTFSQALTKLCNGDVEQHMQRHRKEILQNVTKFLGS